VPELLTQLAATGVITADAAPRSEEDAWLEAYDAVRRDSVAWAAPEAVVGPGHPLAPEKLAAEAPADSLWSSKRVRAPQARSLVPPDRDAPRIGHPDTGWGDHFQLPSSHLDLQHALDAFSGGTDSRDPLELIDLFDGHGTGTASVMISGGEDHLPGSDRIMDPVQGLCPDAIVTPVRCATSVVRFSDLSLSRAIRHGAEIGVDVISISLGGLPSTLLRQEIVHAVLDRDVIVVAAGGQHFPVVPYPAAYDGCIAVAATAPDDRPWEKTTGGRAITVAAPGHQVLVADFGPHRSPIVRSGSGTSYATPHVAAAAALWVAFHGRPQLRARYEGRQPLQAVFRAVLARSARVPDRAWRRDRYGAGILEMEALLRVPLPLPERVRRPPLLTPEAHDLAALADVLAVPVPQAEAALDRSLHVLEPERPVAVSEVLRRLMSLPPDELARLRTSVPSDRSDAGASKLARELGPAVAPHASSHLSERLG
jgi:serine protease